MPESLEFSTLGRLPTPADNVAIALRRIEAGTRVLLEGNPVIWKNTILEGHRFAVHPIHPGDPLLSWGRPFGIATQEIAPGDYVLNVQAKSRPGKDVGVGRQIRVRVTPPLRAPQP